MPRAGDVVPLTGVPRVPLPFVLPGRLSCPADSTSNLEMRLDVAAVQHSTGVGGNISTGEVWGGGGCG